MRQVRECCCSCARLGIECQINHDGRMGSGGYESWFVSARDPASRRALWIRHTRLRPRHGQESVALWCTVAGRDMGERPVVVKQVFGAFPADAAAGADGFRGSAGMTDSAGMDRAGMDRAASWDLRVTGDGPPLRPLRPAALYRAPLPRTKLEATVPDAQVDGTLTVGGDLVSVSGWRGTVGHNWGSEHADSWTWLHADGLGPGGDGWLELALARVRVGPALSPWMAIGALGLGSERLPVGGLGRRPQVTAQPGSLSARIPAAGGLLELTVTSDDADAVAVAYADPSGSIRSVRHAAIATVELTLGRRGAGDLSLSSSSGVYEYGTRLGLPGTTLEALPEG
jgi:hypothetical protein